MESNEEHAIREDIAQGMRIAHIREMACLSVEETSEITGLSVERINAIERGKNAYAGELVLLSDAFGVSLDFLLSVYDVPFEIKKQYAQMRIAAHGHYLAAYGYYQDASMEQDMTELAESD